MERTAHAPSIFPFEELPMELQLHVVQLLVSAHGEHTLLQLRLVCSHMNALVLEPMFWSQLVFSKARFFNSGGGAGGGGRGRSSAGVSNISVVDPAGGSVQHNSSRQPHQQQEPHHLPHSLPQPSLFNSALDKYPQLHQHQHQYHHLSPQSRISSNTVESGCGSSVRYSNSVGTSIGDGRQLAEHQPRQVHPPFLHSSDANLIVHRESFATSLLQRDRNTRDMTFMTGAGALPAEQTALQYPTDSTDARMTTVVPSSATPFISRGEASTNLTVSNDKDSVTTLWAKKQRSFLSFLTRLASQVKSQNQNQNQNESKTLTQQQLPGILRVTIDDWDSHETTMDLLNTLFKLDQLQELSIRHSVLRQIAPDPTIMAEWVVADGDELRYGQEHQPLSRFSKDATLLACQHLTRLDLRDCVHLRDLSEINQWMPNLLDINLEGCLGIDDFRPLSQVDKVLMKTYIPTDDATSAAEYRRWQHGKQKKQEQEQEEQPQYLHVRRLNLSRTSIRDRDLISILERAPCLEELRLDQCYDLTTASLVAIGMGNHLQYAAHGGNSSFSAITVIDSTSVTSGSPPVDTIANSDSSSSITEVTTTTSSVPELKILSVKNCCDLSDEGIRALVGCRRLELLIIRGLRRVPDSTIEWLHEQGVPLRRVLNPLGKWRYWHS